LSLVRAKLIDLLLEIRVVSREEMGREAEPRETRIVAIETALEVAGDGRQTPLFIFAHADRIQFERRHAEVMKELPELR